MRDRQDPRALVSCEAFARAFRSLLWRARPARLQTAVDELMDAVSQLEGPSSPRQAAFQTVYRQARRQTQARIAPATDVKTARLWDAHVAQAPELTGPDFHCDAGLGGLARLLRAAGYDAAFWPGIDDDVLLDEVLRSAAILLTNDALLMRRGVIARGVIPAVLVPITMKKTEQYRFVVELLDLPLQPSRCMACGGPLCAVDKVAVRDRIPPRTYPWCDEYFTCQRCDKLFWKGTHWSRIERILSTARSSSAMP